MENIKEEEKENKEKKPTKKDSVLGRKSSDFYLLNLVSNLVNNEKDFRNQINNNYLELHLRTDSDSSLIDQLNYTLKIKYTSLNPNIINGKINIIKTKLNLEDEYYQNKKFFENIEIDLIPKFEKNFQLNFSFINFHHYNLKTQEIEKYEIPSSINNNKLRLFFYLTKFEETFPIIDKVIENMKKVINNFFDYFENIYIIIQGKRKEEIMRIIKNETIKKYYMEKEKNEDEDNNQKIKILFHLSSSYNESKYIFSLFKQQGKEFYFILDKDDKIISIENKTDNFIDKLFLFIQKFKKHNNNYVEYSLEKENVKKERVSLLKKLITFISNLKNLEYLFSIDFEISFIACINEEFNDIIIKEITKIFIRGEFRSKEYQYLNALCNSLKSKSKSKEKIIDIDLKEMPTIDIDIDFTDIKCQKCSKNITDDSYLYYCYICKMFYCFECVHEQLKNEGKKKYIDQKHNLLFFRTRNKNKFRNIEKMKLGNNKFAESTNDNQFNISHNALCNGCRGNFMKMARYVCLSCRPGIYLRDGFVDYCQKCIEDMCQNENNRKNLEEKANEEIYCTHNDFIIGHIINNIHKHDEHIYLLLPLEYNQVGYTYNEY